jgi:aldehyde dehydrogenase (NAD+)
MNYTGLLKSQKKYFYTGETCDLAFRKKQLKKLRDLITENHEELCDALEKDFGKPRFEAYGAEIATVLKEIDFHLKNVEKWAKPVTANGSLLTFPSRNKIYPQPRGTTLIISPWNYPVYLSLMPLIGAISAGNCAILKPSELVPNISGIVSALINKVFDQEYIMAVDGGVEISQALLKEKFDYIFFTGSKRVGKIVMKAAAENLTPLTLELGGKSPAIVHEDADIEIAARRIWWGKYLNAGQTCVAPDYVVVHEEVRSDFIRESRKVIREFIGKDDEGLASMTRILNSEHFNRLMELVDHSDVVIGGESHTDTRYISLTLAESAWEGPMMDDEIFGPVLPMITFKDFDKLISRLQDMPSPLALYLFTNSKKEKQKVIQKIPFGGGCINETVSHLGTPHLPFGGIGSSGFGTYHGKYSFETFSHLKSILDKPVWPDLSYRYPPYSNKKFSLFKKIFS